MQLAQGSISRVQSITNYEGDVVDLGDGDSDDDDADGSTAFQPRRDGP